MNSLKKRIYISIIFVFFAIVFVFSTSYAQPENILINNVKAYQKKQRPPVNFNHELHMEASECTACHHKYENGENVLDEGELEEGNKEILCSSCHSDKTKINLQKAYHRQCIGCHAQSTKEGQPATQFCADCHPRK